MAFICGKKVCLREVYKQDLETFKNYRNSYEDSKNYRTAAPLTSFNQEKYWETIVNSDKHIVFSVLEKQSQELIGECRLSYIDWVNRKAEIGILIGYGFRNRGYAYEALYLLFEFAFNRIGLHRIEAQVIQSNVASMKLFKKLGFKEEGTIRDGQFFNGKYNNITIMSILDDEFIYK